MKFSSNFVSNAKMLTCTIFVSPRMSLAPLAQTVALKTSEAAQLIAVKDGDFGGYTGPVIGLLIVFVIIAVLTPPVKE